MKGQKWLEECDAALRILRDTSRLHFLCPLLKNKKSLTELLGMAPDKQWDDFLLHYERLRKCSLSIPSDRPDGITRYKFGISGELLEWYPYYIDCAFYPVEKLIDERRRLQGVTIEELADGICTPETVSRIINRRVFPKYSTAAALLDKLGLKGVLREQVIVSEDLEAHKLWSALARCEDMNDSVTAKEIYEKMNNILDCSLKINRMVLEYQRIKLFEHSMDSRQLAHKYETILGMPIKNIMKCTYFTDIEIMLINQYFNCLDRISDYSMLEAYEKLCMTYVKMGKKIKYLQVSMREYWCVVRIMREMRGTLRNQTNMLIWELC